MNYAYAVDGYEQDIVNSTHAGFGIRLLAYIVDVIVIWSLKKIIIAPLVSFFGMDGYIGLPLFSYENIISALIYFLYFILMTWFFRATLGKMMLGLKVVSYNRDHLSFGRVVVRELFGRYISNFFMYLLYLTILFNPSKQGIHDMLADTIVINERTERLRERMIAPYEYPLQDGETRHDEYTQHETHRDDLREDLRTRENTNQQ